MRVMIAGLALAGLLVTGGIASAEEGGAAAGAVAGGTAGAVVGGPVGAAVGAGAGAVVGGAASGPDHVVVEHQHETTGTVTTGCSSSTVQKQNEFGDTKTKTSTNCP